MHKYFHQKVRVVHKTQYFAFVYHQHQLMAYICAAEYGYQQKEHPDK